MLKDLYKINDNRKNSILVNVIDSGIQDVNKKIEEMAEEEKKN